MANALANFLPRRNLGFAGGEGDILNEQAQNYSPSPVITNNTLATLMQPQNFIQRSGGQRINVGPSMQDVNYGGVPSYQDQAGNVVSYTPSGEPVTLTAQERAGYQMQGAKEAALKRLQDQAMMHELQVKAGLAPKEAEKPIFNADAGGYVYPPDAKNPQGRFVPVSGFQKPDKPLTEFQGKAALFGSRAAAASDLIDKLGTGEAGTAKTLQYWQDVPLAGRVVNAMTNPNAQSLAQAQRDFVNSVLRLESGATISPSEFQNAIQQYFPQPGDSPQVVEQKRQNREIAISGLGKLAGSSGGQYVNEQRAAANKAGEARVEQAQPKTMPKAGEVRTASNGMSFKFVGGNPADPNSWQRQ